MYIYVCVCACVYKTNINDMYVKARPDEDVVRASGSRKALGAAVRGLGRVAAAMADLGKLQLGAPWLGSAAN